MNAFPSLPRVSSCISEVKARLPATSFSFLKLALFGMHGEKKLWWFLFYSLLYKPLTYLVTEGNDVAQKYRLTFPST